MEETYEIDETPVIIEVIDSADIPENELSEFQTTQPIALAQVLDGQFTESKEEDEEILITKFVNGESSFPDFYARLGADDDDEFECENSEERSQRMINSFEAELFQSRRDSLKGNLRGVQQRDKKIIRRKPLLSSTLQALMGEANLRFARGQNEMAEQICLEIIRENPLAPEPFLSLAQIYETKDPEKFLQFTTIAAHLERTDPDQWMRIAELHVERNDMQQAKNCYSKAIRYNAKNFELRLGKARLLELMKEERAAMLCYYNMLSIIPPEKDQFCLQIAIRVARYFHENKKTFQALNSMRLAYERVPHLFSQKDIDLYLELLIQNGKYAAVLTTLRDRADLDVIFDQDGESVVIIACIIPDHMLPELRAKLCVSLAHLKAYYLFDYLIQNILECISPIEKIDLYVDIAEAFMKEEKFTETIKLLEPLIKKEDFNPPPYIWLQYADCYRALNQTQPAIDSYSIVVKLAPNYLHARVNLAALLKQQGRYNEALEALKQDLENEVIDPRLLYERCLMLKEMGYLEEYIDIGFVFLLRHSSKLRSREEMVTSMRSKANTRLTNLKSLRESRMENIEDEGPEYLAHMENVSVEQEFEFLIDLMRTAHKLRKFGKLQKLAFTALVSTFFRSKTKEIEKLVIFACLYNEDPHLSFNFLRDRLSKDPRNSAYWNMYNLIVQLGDDIRYIRFVKRLLPRVGYRPYVHNMIANYYLASGSYKYAVNGFVQIFKLNQDPLIALCLAVTFSQMASQKNSSKKATVAAHAIAFGRKYMDLRISLQTKKEVLYNLGRLHHQLGVFQLAIQYYEEALAIPNCEMVEENSETLDLTREIAFNLHLIYKMQGNLATARSYLYKYIVV